MGKNKQQQQQQQQQPKQPIEEQNHHQDEETNNNNGGDDENSNESKTKNNNNNNKQANNNGVIVLGVYLHCQGCVESVVKSLRGFDGVEEIEPNSKDHRVVVKGKTADPVKVADRVREKTGKHVDLISPVISKNKQQPKKPDQQKKQPEVVETVLKMHLHCEGCAKDVKHCLHKMQGVQSVNIDMKASHVIVKGVFDPKDLVAYISKRAGRHAEIVKNQKKNNKNEGNEQKDGNNNNNNNQNENNANNNKKGGKEKENSGGGLAYPNAPPGGVYAPQLFSDENPNACSIM